MAASAESGLDFQTKSGTLVRSKSEAVIADALSDLGVGFDYEAPLLFDSPSSGVRHPDFTVRLAGRVFYWEHVSNFDIHPSYRRHVLRRLHAYIRTGWADRLIVSQGAVDAAEVGRIVRHRVYREASEDVVWAESHDAWFQSLLNAAKTTVAGTRPADTVVERRTGA